MPQIIKNETVLLGLLLQNKHTVKPVVSDHLKIDKTKVLMANGSLMKVGSIADCSLWSILHTFDLHLAIISIEKQFLVFL